MSSLFSPSAEQMMNNKEKEREMGKASFFFFLFDSFGFPSVLPIDGRKG